MNWKAVLLLCLVLFAATFISSVANTTISLTSLGNEISASNSAILETGLIEPMGDPIDDPAAPK